MLLGTDLHRKTLGDKYKCSPIIDNGGGCYSGIFLNQFPFNQLTRNQIEYSRNYYKAESLKIVALK